MWIKLSSHFLSVLFVHLTLFTCLLTTLSVCLSICLFYCLLVSMCICVCIRCYDEDVVIMIARLQMFFFFNDGERGVEKMSRLAFMVLHKLAILAQQVIMIRCSLSILTFLGLQFACTMFSTSQTSRAKQIKHEK